MNVPLVFAYARANLENQIASTYLGWVWWVIEPLLTMAVYYFVFEVLLGRGGDGYVFFLLVGVVTWTWFSNSVTHAAGSIQREKSLIQTINMDKLIFPVVSILENGCKQAIVLLLLLLLLGVTHGVNGYWWCLPLLVVEQILVIGAVSVVLAASVPFFPDLQVIITIALRAGMFCSGVFYTVDMLSPNVASWFLFNPIANLIEQYRAVLIHGKSPDLWACAVISLVSVLVLSFGVQLTRRYNKLYPRLVSQ